jgi:hypothetical protein
LFKLQQIIGLIDERPVTFQIAPLESWAGTGKNKRPDEAKDKGTKKVAGLKPGRYMGWAARAAGGQA